MLYPIADAPSSKLQDPFATIIAGEIVFGGVRVIWNNGRIVSWVTDFYRGSSIYNLKYFTSGPDHMKDIRLRNARRQDSRFAHALRVTRC